MAENSSFEHEYACILCQKLCSTLLSYDLHLKGKQHLKNLKKAKLREETKPMDLISTTSEEKPPEEQSLLDIVLTNTKFASSDIECKICQIKCCGPEAFKQHCKGAGHHKNVERKRLIDEIEFESPPLHQGDSPFTRCDVCHKSFTGLLPYKQHMESITHQKRVRNAEQLANIKDLIIISDEESNNIRCKECGKTFSGPVPFKDHMKSFAHQKLKKNSQLENLKKNTPDMMKFLIEQESESEDTDEEDRSPLGCSACRVPFSDPEEAREHFESAKHKKTVKKIYEYQKYKKQLKGEIKTEASGSQSRLKKPDSSDSDSDFDSEE